MIAINQAHASFLIYSKLACWRTSWPVRYSLPKMQAIICAAFNTLNLRDVTLWLSILAKF
jgi:hypothetical protein